MGQVKLLANPSSSPIAYATLSHTYPHRWSAPKLTIATEYSLRDMHGEGVKYGYAHYLIFEFHRGRKSIESAQNSKAVRPHPMYLGGVLVLTCIVYYAMNNKFITITIAHTTRYNPKAHHQTTSTG